MKRIFIFCTLGLILQGAYAQYSQYYGGSLCLAQIEEAKAYSDPQAFADSVAAHTIQCDEDLPIIRDIERFNSENEFSDLYAYIAHRMNMVADSLVFYPLFRGFENEPFDTGDDYLHSIRLCKRQSYLKPPYSLRDRKLARKGGIAHMKTYFALCLKYACISQVEVYDRQKHYLATYDLQWNSYGNPLCGCAFGNIPQYPQPLYIVSLTFNCSFLFFLTDKEFISISAADLCWPSPFSSMIESERRSELWTMVQLELQYP